LISFVQEMEKPFHSRITGKLIPLDEEGDEHHNCAEWKDNAGVTTIAETVTAKYILTTHISKNGKYIQLSKATGEPHQCEDTERLVT
jgi:hypothetical protein